eukprot:m.143298 g.143298  ORF g.143298 m.143298 type:complete len:783 (-) comp14985_c0_seq1:97-2445(-)
MQLDVRYYKFGLVGASADGQGAVGPAGECGNFNCQYLQAKNDQIHELKTRLAEQAFMRAPQGRTLRLFSDLKEDGRGMRLRHIAERTATLFSEPNLSHEYGLRLVSCVFAESRADGSVVLDAEGQRAAHVHVLYFTPDAEHENRLRRVVKMELGQFPFLHHIQTQLSDLVHPQPAPSGEGPLPPLTDRLVAINSLHLVPQIVTRAYRRLLGDHFPPNWVLQNANTAAAKCVPIVTDPPRRCAMRTFTSTLRYMLEHSASFREKVLALGPHRLPVVLHADGGENSSDTGVVCLTAKPLLCWAACGNISLDSLLAEVPLGLLWSRHEDANEMQTAFQPVLDDLHHLQAHGLALPGPAAPTLRFLFINANDLKIVEECLSVEGGACSVCGVHIADIKLDTDSTRSYTINTTVPPLAKVTYMPNIMRSMLNSVPDLLHLTKNTLKTLLKPVIEMAIASPDVRLRFALCVRRHANMPRFAFRQSSTGRISMPSLDASHYCKIFAALQVEQVLQPSAAAHTSPAIKKTFALFDVLLRALHVDAGDPNYLSPEAYKAAAKKAERSFRFSHTSEAMTKYIHYLLHHIPEYLEQHETIYQFSMQSSEALVYRIRRVFFRNTMHHDHRVDPGHPAIVGIMQNFNKLLQGLAKGLFLPGDLAAKHKAGDDDDDEPSLVGPEAVLYNPHHWVPRVAFEAPELPLGDLDAESEPVVVNVGGHKLDDASEAGPAVAEAAETAEATEPAEGGAGAADTSRAGHAEAQDDDDDDDEEPAARSERAKRRRVGASRRRKE